MPVGRTGRIAPKARVEERDNGELCLHQEQAEW